MKLRVSVILSQIWSCSFRVLSVCSLIVGNALCSFAQTQQGAPIVADSTNASGQSTSGVFIDTTKIIGTPTNSVNNRIMNCLATYTKCDASKDSGTVDGTISIAQSGVTLILGNISSPAQTAPSYGIQLLNITGSNNDISCGQGWNPPSSMVVGALDAHLYSGYTSPGNYAHAVIAISISGTGNKFHDCSIQGSYLNDVGSGLTPQSYQMGDCIFVQGNDNIIERNRLQYCGNNGINAQNTNRAKIRDNYSLQSWSAGINVDASTTGVASSIDGDVNHNWVQDANLKAAAGIGDINISSSGGYGALQGWLVHDNFVFNTTTLCNAAAGTPMPTDHGCSEGIQATEKPWNISISNNYVYNTGSEGITLCQYNCSATGNLVGDAGQQCGGCGGILQAVQGPNASVTAIGNTLVEGNTIWNDTSTPMKYCMWQNVSLMYTATTAQIINNNWIGNTCRGIGTSIVTNGFYFTNLSSTATVTITGVNLIGNTIDPATVTNPINEVYSLTIVGVIYHGFNNIYSAGVGSPLLSLPTPGDLAFFDPNSGTNGSYNLLDAVFLNYTTSAGTSTLKIGAVGDVGNLALANSSVSGVVTLTPASGSSVATVTIPDITDTLVNLTSAQTLTNKSINGSNNTLSNVALSSLSAQAADTVVMNATSGSALPTAVTLDGLGGTNSCSGAGNALQWNSSTHAWACNISITSSSVPLNGVLGATAQATGTESAAGDNYTFAGIETAALTYPFVIQNTSNSSNTSGSLIINTKGTGAAQVPLLLNETTAAGNFINAISGGTVTNGVQSGGTSEFSVSAVGAVAANASLSIGGGTALTTTNQSGTGSLCMTTNCALTTPNLGIPSALTLTNAAGMPLSGLSGATSVSTNTEMAAGDRTTFAGIETANLTYPFVFTDANSTANNTSGALILQTTGTSTMAVPLLINEATAAGNFVNFINGGTVTNGVESGGTSEFSVSATGAITATGPITLGVASSANGSVALANSTTASQTTLLPGAPTTAATITLPPATSVLTSVVATNNTTLLTGVIPPTTIYSVPNSSIYQGLYRVCYTTTITRAGATSSTLGPVSITFTDNDTGGTITLVGSSSTANMVGTQLNACVTVNAKIATTIQYSQNYASAGSPVMQYASHEAVEALY